MAPPHKRKTGKQSKAIRQRSRQVSAEDYYIEAEMAYISDDLDRARSCFQRALDLEPDHGEYLDGYGAFLAECGPLEEAVSVLQRACDRSPEEGFEKFMYLGQVLDQAGRSSEAENFMRRGITILRTELSAARDEGHATDTDTDSGAEVGKEAFQEALCSALCSLAELLMGMAAETADEAEDAVAAAAPALEEAEILLQEARELWRSSPEPLQALASLRRVQGRDEDALALLRQSMALWYREDAQGNEVEGEENGAAVAGDRKHGDVVGFGDHRATPGTNGDALDVDIDGEHEESSTLPSYEFRFETAKLLLELDDTTDAAIDVLEGLLEENDVVPDVWLLLAVAHRAGGEAEAAAEAAAEGASVAQRLGLPPGHEVAAALEEIKGELAGLSLSGLGGGGIGDKGNER